MQNRPWPSTEMMKSGQANSEVGHALVELAPCPLTRSWGQGLSSLKVANRAFSIGFPSGCRLESLKAKLQEKGQTESSTARKMGYGLSLAINVVAQTTTYDSPWTGISTPIPMECKWVIVLLPASETFSTAKAFDIVSGIPTRVEEEASFGEGVRCSDKVGRVGPFKGYGTLRC
jgi:hypothetical protein